MKDRSMQSIQNNVDKNMFPILATISISFFLAIVVSFYSVARLARENTKEIDTMLTYRIYDIGAGTTDVAVISLGGLVVSQSIQVGGNKFNEAIIEYLRKECNILVGNQTAENIKKDLAAALPLDEPRTIHVRGVNQLNTSAGTVQFTSEQAHEAVKNPCKAIVKAIRWVLERTPPELAADIMKGGIHLTGDGARLFALDRFISESLGMPVLLARDPGDCCILGIGYLTENIQLVTPQDKRSRPSMK